MNNLNKKYYKIANEIAQKISIFPTNRFVVIIGSVANQLVDKYSDIDLVVFYTKEPTKKELENIFNIPTANKFWLDDTKFHIHIKIEGIDATTLFVSQKYLEALMNKMPNLTLDDFAILSRYIGEAKLLHGDAKMFTTWGKVCNKIPKKIKNDTIHHRMSSLNFWFRQGNLINLTERSDWLMINRTLNHSIEWILTVIYLLNEKIYLNPKRAKNILENCLLKPKNIAKRLENLYILKNTKNDIMKKNKEMVSIMDDVEKLVKKNQ